MRPERLGPVETIRLHRTIRAVVRLLALLRSTPKQRNTNAVHPQVEELTKQDLAEYYVRMADWILPHVRDRLLTLVRCPAGHDKPCFYQKHAKQGLPKAIYSHALQHNATMECRLHSMMHDPDAA